MKTVLIIGYVWLEQTSGAGTRMIQLIEQFVNANYNVVFASASQKNSNSLELLNMGVQEKKIELNSSKFDTYINNLSPDIVVFDRFMTEEQFGWRVAENCPKALRILDTEDLHSLRKTRQNCLKKEIPFSIDALKNSEIAKREIASIYRSDLSLIISEYELNLLQNNFKIDKSLLFQLPFLIDHVNEDEILNWCSFEKRKDFIFVGNFLHQPNVDATLQLKKIWKDIRKKIPNVNINICGAYPTQQIKELHNENEGFLIKGFIKDIITEVKKSRVVLAPLRFGAGIKGKLLEAMYCGTPSVTTPIGAEGMNNKLPWNGTICDLNTFSQNAISLYEDKNTWEVAQKNGITIVNNLYNKSVLGEKFINQVGELEQNISNHRKQNFIGNLLQLNTLQSKKYMSKWIEEKSKRK